MSYADVAAKNANQSPEEVSVTTMQCVATCDNRSQS